MSSDHPTDSSPVKDEATNQAGAVKDHAAAEAADVKDHAVSEAGDVKDHAVGAARDVTETAKSEAKSVARDARAEFRGLVDSSMDELNTQLGSGQTRLASELRNLVDEVGEMAEGGQHHGYASDLARELNQRGQGLVEWLDRHEPRDVVPEIRRYAARNPWTFLAIAAGAGLLVGRFARGVRDDNNDDSRSLTRGQEGHSRALTSGAPAYSDDHQRYAAPQAAELSRDAQGQYAPPSSDHYPTQTGINEGNRQ